MSIFGETTITLADPKNFEPGQRVTIWEFKPWYIRLWRWLTRYKPPVLTITSVDHANSVVTIAENKKDQD